MPSSRVSSQPRDQTWVSCGSCSRQVLYLGSQIKKESPREAPYSDNPSANLPGQTKWVGGGVLVESVLTWNKNLRSDQSTSVTSFTAVGNSSSILWKVKKWSDLNMLLPSWALERIRADFVKLGRCVITTFPPGRAPRANGTPPPHPPKECLPGGKAVMTVGK